MVFWKFILIDRLEFLERFRQKKTQGICSCKVLDQLKGSSGAQVEVDGSIKSGELVMDFTSGSNFKGDIR